MSKISIFFRRYLKQVLAAPILIVIVTVAGNFGLEKYKVYITEEKAKVAEAKGKAEIQKKIKKDKKTCMLYKDDMYNAWVVNSACIDKRGQHKYKPKVVEVTAGAITKRVSVIMCPKTGDLWIKVYEPYTNENVKISQWIPIKLLERAHKKQKKPPEKYGSGILETLFPSLHAATNRLSKLVCQVIYYDVVIRVVAYYYHGVGWRCFRYVINRRTGYTWRYSSPCNPHFCRKYP